MNEYSQNEGWFEGIGEADVVFCLDASNSMKSCFDGFKTHIISLLEDYEPKTGKTIRFDFMAHNCVKSEEGRIEHRHNSLYHNGTFEDGEDALSNLYLKGGNAGRFFTSDIEEFKHGLEKVEVLGDSGPLVALDSCLDFPWRNVNESHRIVVFLTTEPFENSINAEMEKQFLEEIMEKIKDLRVMLFVVGPECPVYEALTEVDKSEFELVESRSACLEAFIHGLSTSIFADFITPGYGCVPGAQVLSKEVKRGVFGQCGWELSPTVCITDSSGDEHNVENPKPEESYQKL